MADKQLKRYTVLLVIGEMTNLINFSYLLARHVFNMYFMCHVYINRHAYIFAQGYRKIGIVIYCCLKYKWMQVLGREIW